MSEATENISAGSLYEASVNEQKDAGVIIVPVIKEEIQIEKKVVETGKVRLVKTVNEHLESVTVPLLQEGYNVERIAVNEYLQTPPAIRYEGDIMIIPVIREELVVEKRILLVEELRVTKTRVQTNETRQVSLREEEVSIEHIKNNDQA